MVDNFGGCIHDFCGFLLLVVSLCFLEILDLLKNSYSIVGVHRLIHFVCVTIMLGFSVYEFQHLPIDYAALGGRVLAGSRQVHGEFFNQLRQLPSKLLSMIPSGK